MKRLVLVFALIVTGAVMMFAEGQKETTTGPWVPTRNVEWYCTSSPGGGSSIFTQMIIEIIKEENLVDKDLLINYKTDGGGAVGRREVSRKENQGHTLLTFNNGDLQPMVQIENGDLDDFTPLAVMATDGQLLMVRNDSRFKTAKDFLDALAAGERVIMGGSKGDDVNLFEKIKAEVGGNLEYLMSDSTGVALTQILGGSIEVVISKPAAAFELVNSKELRPIIAATRDPFSGAFAAPTFKELGYNIELTVFRGIVGPKSMPAEAVAFWSDVFTKVAATDKWKNNYLNKFLLNGNHLAADAAKPYMQAFEDIYMAGKK